MKSFAKAIAIVALLCISTVFASKLKAPQTPTWPAQYTFSGTFSLPYWNLSEPIFSAVDTINNLQTISYYNGMDTYYYLNPQGLYFQVNPVNGTRQACFSSAASGTVTQMMPNLNSWSYTGTAKVNNIPTYQWTLKIVNGSKVNTYNMYVSSVDGKTPVQYSWLGYDMLFGSHYDVYVLDYTSFTPTVNPSVFEIPPLCKTSKSLFEGDVATIKNGVSKFAENFPCHSDDLHCHFNKFQHKHNRHYKHINEVEKRKKFFKDNFDYISQHNKNKDQHGFELGVNHLTDMSVPEIKNKYLMAKNFDRTKKGVNQLDFVSQNLGSNLPSSVDWRTKGAVSQVKDQADCGSCWTFSTTGVIEGQYFLKNGNFIEFSEQNLVDCSWVTDNYGCDGGVQKQAYEYIIQNGGLNTEADYRYLMVDGYCKYNPDNFHVTLSSYVGVPVGDEEALKEAVATVGPIAVSIDAGHPSMLFYSSGVYYEPLCQNSPFNLDHAVLVVGYGSTTQNGQQQDYWIVKNNWSSNWGNQGYIWMARNRFNNCGIASDASYPIIN